MFIVASRRKHHAIIRAGLLGWWPFSEGSGSVVHDLSDNGGDGTLIGAEAEDWITGPLGKPALNLDDGEYVELNSQAISNIGGRTTGALCFFFKCRSAASGGGMLRAMFLGDGQSQYAFASVSSGNITAEWADESLLYAIQDTSHGLYPKATIRNGTGYYADGAWHHLAWVCNAVANRLYIDGIAATTSFNTGFSATSNIFTNTGSAANIFRIGSWRAGGTDYYGNNAQIADVRFYSALSAANIAEIAGGRG